MSKITHIVVHYSATFEDQDLGVAEIDRMHKARGWKSVGYHYVIRLDGRVEKGREEWRTGAHVAGQNTGKIGICAVGGLRRATGPTFGVDTRTPAQKAAMIALIRELLVRHPGAKVVGHRDLAATQCPGFDVIEWWASVQADRRPVASVPISPNAPATTPGVREDTEHVVERGETIWGIAVKHGLHARDLAQWNRLPPDNPVIRPGDVLRLVKPPIRPRVYPPLPTPAPEPPEKEATEFWSWLFAAIAARFRRPK